MNKQDIGKFIRDKRLERGWSQSQLAEKANLSYRAILDIEKDKRSFNIEAVTDIMDKLGYEIEFIPKSVTINEMRYVFKGLLPAQVGDKHEKEFKTQNEIQ